MEEAAGRQGDDRLDQKRQPGADDHLASGVTSGKDERSEGRLVRQLSEEDDAERGQDYRQHLSCSGRSVNHAWPLSDETTGQLREIWTPPSEKLPVKCSQAAQQTSMVASPRGA